MNCSQCLGAAAGFLSAYWLTLAVSACVFGSALLALVWSVRSGEWASGEQAKHEMMRRD